MVISCGIEIGAPAEVVFAWLTERDKIRQWLPGLVGSEITRRTSQRIGTTLRQIYQVRGRRVVMPVEVLALEPNRRLVVRTRTRKQDSTFDYRVEPLARGARLTAVANVRLLGLMKLVGILTGESLRERFSQGCREDFGRLKRCCERA